MIYCTEDDDSQPSGPPLTNDNFQPSGPSLTNNDNSQTSGPSLTNIPHIPHKGLLIDFDYATYLDQENTSTSPGDRTVGWPKKYTTDIANVLPDYRVHFLLLLCKFCHRTARLSIVWLMTWNHSSLCSSGSAAFMRGPTTQRRSSANRKYNLLLCGAKPLPNIAWFRFMPPRIRIAQHWMSSIYALYPIFHHTLMISRSAVVSYIAYFSVKWKIR